MMEGVEVDWGVTVGGGGGGGVDGPFKGVVSLGTTGKDGVEERFHSNHHFILHYYWTAKICIFKKYLKKYVFFLLQVEMGSQVAQQCFLLFKCDIVPMFYHFSFLQYIYSWIYTFLEKRKGEKIHRSLQPWVTKMCALFPDHTASMMPLSCLHVSGATVTDSSSGKLHSSMWCTSLCYWARCMLKHSRMF